MATRRAARPPADTRPRGVRRSLDNGVGHCSSPRCWDRFPGSRISRLRLPTRLAGRPVRVYTTRDHVPGRIAARRSVAAVAAAASRDRRPGCVPRGARRAHPRDGGQEVVARERVEARRRSCRDGRRARRVVEQRDLAEAVAAREARREAGRGADGDLAVGDRVEEVAGLALADEDVAGAGGERLHRARDALQLGWRQRPEERHRAQQPDLDDRHRRARVRAENRGQQHERDQTA